MQCREYLFGRIAEQEKIAAEVYCLYRVVSPELYGCVELAGAFYPSMTAYDGFVGYVFAERVPAVEKLRAVVILFDSRL